MRFPVCLFQTIEKLGEMVLVAFPIAKLGFLLMKQLSKPIANYIKNQAKSHPFFRRYVCIPPAKAYHWIEMQTKLHVKGRWKPVTVVPITEAEAVELGSSLIGEVTLFALLSAVLFFEISRQGDKKAEKEKIKEDELVNLIETVISLMEDVQTLKTSINEIKAEIGAPHKYDFTELEGLKQALLTTADHVSSSKSKQKLLSDDNDIDPKSSSPSF